MPRRRLAWGLETRCLRRPRRRTGAGHRAALVPSDWPAAACGDSSTASRSRSPRAGPPTGSAAAGHARHTSRSGLHGLGTGPHVPSLCAPPAPVPPATGPGRPPALLGGHGSYGCLGGAAPGAQGRAGGSARDARAEDRLLPSPVQFCSVVAPPEPTQASAALKVTLHRDTLTASRERSPRRLQDSPTHTGRWTGQLSSPPAQATVPRGAGSFLRRAGAAGLEHTALGSRHVRQDRQSQRALGPGAGPGGGSNSAQRPGPGGEDSAQWCERCAWRGCVGRRIRAQSTGLVPLFLKQRVRECPPVGWATSSPGAPAAHHPGPAKPVGPAPWGGCCRPHGSLPRTPMGEAGDPRADRCATTGR